MREATGLVRNLGFFDQLVIALSVASPMGGFVLTALYAPYFFPGANLALVFLLGCLPAFAMAFIYSKMSAAIPKTGGDYVWSTRILGPAYGSVQLVFFTGPFIILGAAVSAYFFDTLGLSQLLFAYGVTTDNTGLISLAGTVTTPNIGFAIGLVLLLVMAVVALLGIRVFAVLQRIVVISFLVLTLIFIGILATLNSSAVPANFNHAMQLVGSNTTYSGIIQQAASRGLSAGGFSLGQTLLAAIPWGFLTFGGFNWGVYLVGETKNPGKSMFRALFLAVGISTAGLAVLTLLSFHVFGSNFINSADFVLANNPSALPTSPTISLLVSLASPWYAVLIEGGIVLTFLGLVPINIIALSRMFFAASFDRLLPTKLAATNERLHSPYLSVIIVTILNIAYFSFLWFGGFATSFLNSSLEVPVAYLMPMVATGLFYYRRRSLFMRVASGVVRPASLILASIIGVFCFAVYIAAETFPIISGVFLGTSLYLAYGYLAILIVIGLIVYATARVRLSREGLAIRTIYSEIPPE